MPTSRRRDWPKAGGAALRKLGLERYVRKALCQAFKDRDILFLSVTVPV